MSPRSLVSIGALAVAAAGTLAAVSAGLWLAPGTAAAQVAADRWTAPRTPWGDPDLQGIWNSKTITPLQRPDEFAGRAFLTDEEAAALEQKAQTTPVRDGPARAERGTRADVDGSVNDAFLSSTGVFARIVATKRTSLVIDPPDGKIPWTSEGQKRVADEAANRTNRRSQDTVDGPEAAGDRSRCLGPTLPCTSALCGFTRIVQTPGSLAIYYESGSWGGAYRIIPLDGRPHFSQDIRLRMGDSRGSWEGDTLVVDTTNFTDQTSFQGSREKLHLVERFTRVDDDMILYEVTVDDSTSFARPWTIELPWTKEDNKKNMIFETACHEWNYGLTNILANARFLEKEAAAIKTRAR